MRRALNAAYFLLGFFIVFGLVFFFYGPAASPTACPKYDVVQLVMTPFGPMVIQTKKDSYAEKYHSLKQFKHFSGWITFEEYRAWQQELREKAKEGAI